MIIIIPLSTEINKYINSVNSVSVQRALTAKARIKSLRSYHYHYYQNSFSLDNIIHSFFSHFLLSQSYFQILLSPTHQSQTFDHCLGLLTALATYSIFTTVKAETRLTNSQANSQRIQSQIFCDWKKPNSVQKSRNEFPFFATKRGEFGQEFVKW